MASGIMSCNDDDTICHLALICEICLRNFKFEDNVWSSGNSSTKLVTSEELVYRTDSIFLLFTFELDLSSKFVLDFQVRDELEQLLDDDDDMADLYLSRKLAASSSPESGYSAPNWFFSSPTIGSKISRTISRTSTATGRAENDVEELEMLLEVYSTNSLHQHRQLHPLLS